METYRLSLRRTRVQNRVMSSWLIAGLLLLSSQVTLSQSWQLVWSDEFTNGIGPDWVFETGTGSGGWGNNELQYYRQQNATVENGQLVITARHESFGGMNYTSARMKTQGRKSWKYGRVEARIALPSFTGSWPAFWMLGDNISSVSWPACGEIDVMEHVNTSAQTHGTIHWQDHNGNYASYGGNTNTNVTSFHLYAIEWNSASIKWFVDGNLFHEASISGGVNGTHEFHNNFFILLNMAIGGNWPGFNVDNGAFPARMLVDYVRVYQGSSSGWSTQIEAENWAVQSGVQTESCSEGGQNVGWIDANDWIVWNVNLPSSGTYTVEYRVASLNGGGNLQLEKAGGSPVYGTRTVPNTGGWQNWTTVSHNVNLNGGAQQIAIKALSGGWNINWLKISSSGGSRLTQVSAADESQLKETLIAYPNPTTDFIHINGLEGNSRFTIHDLSGKVVLKGILETDGDRVKVDVSDLKAGSYFFVEESGQKISFIRK